MLFLLYKFNFLAMALRPHSLIRIMYAGNAFFVVRAVTLLAIRSTFRDATAVHATVNATDRTTYPGEQNSYGKQLVGQLVG